MQPVSSLCIFCRLSCMRRGKERKPEKAAVLAALVGYIGQGLFTGPYILTYVFYIIFLGVLGAYYRMGKEKGAEA